MLSGVFLAVNGQELAHSSPKHTAYMALHFSAYGKGLSNIPNALPPECILLLDDSTPPEQHIPDLVVSQMTDIVDRVRPVAVLLDFQRSVTDRSMEMARQIVNALPCSIGATKEYATALGCHIFLPPIPVNQAPEDYLAPWLKQGVYLEIAPEGLEYIITEAGSRKAIIPIMQGLPFRDKKLHCHYNVDILQDTAYFRLCRYKTDLAELVEEAQGLGVLGCVGLYSELAE